MWLCREDQSPVFSCIVSPMIRCLRGPRRSPDAGQWMKLVIQKVLWSSSELQWISTLLMPNAFASPRSLPGGNESCSCLWAGGTGPRCPLGTPCFPGLCWAEGSGSPWESAALLFESWAFAVLFAGQAAGQTAGLPWQRQCLAFLKEKLARFMCGNGCSPSGVDAV